MACDPAVLRAVAYIAFLSGALIGAVVGWNLGVRAAGR